MSCLNVNAMAWAAERTSAVQIQRANVPGVLSALLSRFSPHGHRIAAAAQ